MGDVLHPGEVRVASGRHAILPALIVAEALAAPVGYVERRIGQDEVGFQIWMTVIVERIAVAIWPSMPRMAKFILARRQVV
jgi:hypothetical protein